MKGFFQYELKSNKLDDGQNEAILSFIFKPTGYIPTEVLAEGIEAAGIAAPFPDYIFIQCINREFEELKSDSKTSIIKQSIRRISKRSKVFIVSYDNNGTLKLIHQVGVNKQEITLKNLLKKFLIENHQEVLTAGLAELFSAKGVIQIAPSGFTFVKPSGDRSRIFLKTEEALSSSERVHFVAFSLLPKLAIRNKSIITPIDAIFIDTMGIASVAYALRDLHWDASSNDPHLPRIESFHSHSGLTDFNAPLNGTTFCLISASQSMRLQDLWTEKNRTTESPRVSWRPIGLSNTGRFRAG